MIMMYDIVQQNSIYEKDELCTNDLITWNVCTSYQYANFACA